MLLLKQLMLVDKELRVIFDPLTLMESFEKEIKMAYKMRKETRHVVTIYGFDFDPQRGLALMAMELGGDTLAKRIEVLHIMKDMERKRQYMLMVQ